MTGIRLLYQVVFLTYGPANPDRLGTAEEVGAKIRVWAVDADDAIAIGKRIADRRSLRWLKTLSVDGVGDVYVEQIANDPLNPGADEEEVQAAQKNTSEAGSGLSLVQ